MAGLEIKFDARKLEALTEEMAGAGDLIRRGMETAVAASLFRVHSVAARPGYVPVKTGNLRRSLTWLMGNASVGAVEGAVGSNLSYARIHELGGMTGRNHAAKIPAKHYLGRAIEDSKDYVADQFKKIRVLRKH